MSENETRLPEATRYIRDLGIARIDSGRYARTGAPEAIFAQGKRPDVLRTIVAAHDPSDGPLLVTRATPLHLEAVADAHPAIQIHETARMATVGEAKPSGREVGVVAAGSSDLYVAEEAAVSLTTLGHRVDRIYDVGVAGLHRVLEALPQIVDNDVVIVVAGMEGALPRVLGGLCDAPMIAVPTAVGYGAHFDGLTALLGMLSSCAPGMAVVNIDNGFGAAMAAHRILRRL